MGQAKQRKISGNYPDTNKPKPSAQTVSWEVLGDLGTHPKCEAVIELLTELRATHEAFGGKTMFVTLESAFRVPVIKARVVGLEAFIGLIEGLQEMGLSDRLEHQAGTENGVDAAFS